MGVFADGQECNEYLARAILPRFSANLGPWQPSNRVIGLLHTRRRRNFAGIFASGAGWSSPVARQAHNLKVVGSNPTPATKDN
jgi:hypothetical protein